MAYFALVIIAVASVLGISALLGQKTPIRRATAEQYESGIVQVGTSNIPISVDFYLVAMFFVIFDLETAFIFAWAVAFYDLGIFGYIEICVFILVLMVALVYVLRSGALEWASKRPVGRGLAAQSVLERSAREGRR